ncbi:TldD/PmbA family protein [Bacillus sp. RG28]|uniref:TldD/PmbA family protein n=1 Tax=Gottfriedia endophytica TaxID=2820819 RepID=A0A940SK03_9BACI|nr:TldD/PmbA family protein [Gottfriedia endophytica]MBP0726560.1 TldD/PmbA family protein [Gottfriedia endophytica]
MLSKEVVNLVLSKALSTGGDFSEIFVEDNISNNIILVDGKIDSVVEGKTFGVGLRVFKGLKSVYVYTNEYSLDALLQLAKKAAVAIGDLKQNITVNVTKHIHRNINPILEIPSSISAAKKIDVVKTAYRSARDYSSEIVQAKIRYVDSDQKVLIANSEGLYTEDHRALTRLSIQSIASDGVENQIGSEGPGARMGLELFQHIDPEHYAKEASRTAVTMLHARNCPIGKMTVAIENGFGGVIFHEACGHSLEATAIAKGNSEFCDKIGMQIANPKVTAIDDGTMPNLWGSLTIDDEGCPTQRNVLIENGILKGYLIDKLNGRRMNMKPTGSSRRESYKFAPTSRMTNTYIDNGDDRNEDIISSISDGLYAKKMGGGSINPATGEFNFAVSEAYIVKNGKIQEPVRGASLIGRGSEVLMKIDMVGTNLAHGQGMCGSVSGSIPANVGQPLIRVSEMTVGGRAEGENE